MNNNNNTHHAVFVGLGLSGVRTFSGFVEGVYQHYQQSPEQFAVRFSASPLRLTLIDETGEVGGLAYNRDRSPMPLLLHNSTQTLTPIVTFQRWLAKNKDRALAYMDEFTHAPDHASSPMSGWLNRHRTHIDAMHEQLADDETAQTLIDRAIAGDFLTAENGGRIFDAFAQDDGQPEEWRLMRIPRAVYGLFLHDELAEAMRKLHEINAACPGCVQIDAWQGTMVNPRHHADGTELAFEFADNMAQRLEWQFVGGGIDKDGQRIIGASTDPMKFVRVGQPEAQETIIADQLAFMVGIPTPKEWPEIFSQETDWWRSYFPNMYAHTPPGEYGAHSFEALSHAIIAKAAQQELVEVTVLGNRASAADLWVWIMNDPALSELVDNKQLRLTHISTKGADGVRPPAKPQRSDYDASEFIANLAHCTTAQQLLGLYIAELEQGRSLLDEAGRTMGPDAFNALSETQQEQHRLYSHYDIVSVMNPLLKAMITPPNRMTDDVQAMLDQHGLTPLPPEETLAFHYGDDWQSTPANQHNLLNFLTAVETIEARDFLLSHAAIKFVQGRFDIEHTARNDEQWTIPLFDGEAVSGDIVVNCAGSKAHAPETEKLSDLFHNRLVSYNQMGTGMMMDPSTGRAVPPDWPEETPLPPLYVDGIVGRGSRRPGPEHEIRTDDELLIGHASKTAAGNQQQLDESLDVIIRDMLRDVGIGLERDVRLQRLTFNQSFAMPSLTG